MFGQRGVADATTALAGAGIALRCAGQGAGGSTFAFVVNAADLGATVQLLHERLLARP
jgi:hypothetical protein